MGIPNELRTKFDDSCPHAMCNENYKHWKKHFHYMNQMKIKWKFMSS
jgi:hypothetical protein